VRTAVENVYILYYLCVIQCAHIIVYSVPTAAASRTGINIILYAYMVYYTRYTRGIYGRRRMCVRARRLFVCTTHTVFTRILTATVRVCVGQCIMYTQPACAYRVDTYRVIRVYCGVDIQGDSFVERHSLFQKLLTLFFDTKSLVFRTYIY